MLIEAGKYYRNADGEKIGPIISDGKTFRGSDGQYTWNYFPNGQAMGLHKNSKRHLIEEWSEPEEQQVPDVSETQHRHIDQMRAVDYQRGVAKIWDSYRI